MHFAEVRYTLVLVKEVKWNSEITLAWLTSDTVNDFGRINRQQKWQFWYINNFRENTMRKKIGYLFWMPLTNRYNFQLPFGCTNFPVYWGHARRHGKRSLEMLTVERAGYAQGTDCHYFDSWLVHRWSMCKSWLVLMCRLNIVIFGIFATFGVSLRPVLSVEHEPEIAGLTATATASTRHWQPECFLIRE